LRSFAKEITIGFQRENIILFYTTCPIAVYGRLFLKRAARTHVDRARFMHGVRRIIRISSTVRQRGINKRPREKEVSRYLLNGNPAVEATMRYAVEILRSPLPHRAC